MIHGVKLKHANIKPKEFIEKCREIDIFTKMIGLQDFTSRSLPTVQKRSILVPSESKYMYFYE